MWVLAQAGFFDGGGGGGGRGAAVNNLTWLLIRKEATYA